MISTRTPDGRFATKTVARQFIERRFGANDLMAIVHTAGSTDASQEFTNNKRLLLAAIDKTMGRKLDVGDDQQVTRVLQLSRDSASRAIR